MAKIYGINGVITGKAGAAVYAVRNGEQILRQYQPIVANPSTPAQVAARAKLKLMSQLSTVMAPVIAMRRQGSVSARNMFVTTNYRATTYSDNMANITLTSVKLTRSVVSLPAIQVVRSQNNATVGLVSNSGVNISRMVYAIFSKQADGTLSFVGSQVVSVPGENFNYTANFLLSESANLVVYGYGVRDNTEAARVAFGNMQALTAESVAKLVTTSVLLESDVTLTETRSVESPQA